jgi:hypothetical protein
MTFLIKGPEADFAFSCHSRYPECPSMQAMIADFSIVCNILTMHDRQFVSLNQTAGIKLSGYS